MYGLIRYHALKKFTVHRKRSQNKVILEKLLKIKQKVFSLEVKLGRMSKAVVKQFEDEIKILNTHNNRKVRPPLK
jgi:hypothetical protein